jgi:hypothetical protein
VFRFGTSAALVALLLSARPPAARAEGCPAIAGGGAALAEIDPELRLHFIDERLARTAHHAQIWTWGWGLGIGAATVGNVIPLFFVKP